MNIYAKILGLELKKWYIAVSTKEHLLCWLRRRKGFYQKSNNTEPTLFVQVELAKMKQVFSQISNEVV